MRYDTFVDIKGDLVVHESQAEGGAIVFHLRHGPSSTMNALAINVQANRIPDEDWRKYVALDKGVIDHPMCPATLRPLHEVLWEL